MRIPLHLSADDYSKDAAYKRLQLNLKMAELNPQGFCALPKRKNQKTRNEHLTKMAGLS